MLPHAILNLKQTVGDKPLAEWCQLFLNHMLTIDQDFDPGHQIDHVIRVAKAAVEIAQQENASLAVVLPAAILHDSQPVNKFAKDRAKASTLSAEHSIQLLTDWGYPADYYPAIKHAIQAHSFSAGISPESLEAKVVQDADRLDALGAIGVARTMAVGFNHELPLYNAISPFPGEREADERTNILDHFYIKLFRLTETLHTASAKAEGERRVQAMEIYLQALAGDIGAEYVSYQNYIKLRK